MKTSLRLFAGLMLLTLAGSLPAAVTVSRLNGFNKTWQFINTDATYSEIKSTPSGYFKDYNGDGIPDYLICLQSAAGSIRLFTINTSATGGDKSYGDKTAGRDFAAVPGSSVPQRVFTPCSPKSNTPDLVVYSSDSGGTNGVNSSVLTFQRLNTSDTAWPTQTQWTITMPFKATWVVTWPTNSFDSDDYPDFFIYNESAPTDNRKFVLGLYNGQTGKQIWQKTLTLDPGDTGSGIPNTSLSNILIYPLPLMPVSRIGNGDFDNDGKPEFFLYYTYGKLDTVQGELVYNTCINMLNASGNPLAPYTSNWTKIGPANTPGSPYLIAIRSDLDQDGYRDLVLTFPDQTTSGVSAPVFMGYSLKKRMVLFQSTNSDFGNTGDDESEFQTFEAYDFSRFAPISVAGDGKPDLTLFRDKWDGGPVEIGLFHGVGGNGRKVWLSSPDAFSNFDRVHMIPNDFNYDNVVDFALVQNPTDPATPTWTIANTALTAAGITLGKQFTYTSSVTDTRGMDQDLDANTGAIGYFGDVKGDGQRDTWAGLFWELSTDGVTQSAGGSLIIYDTPPPTSSAAVTTIASLDIKVTNEDWSNAPMLRVAKNLNEYSYVDNNGDNLSNDVIVQWDVAIFALSFKTKGIYPLAGQATTPTPANGASLRVGRPLLWEPANGTYGDSSFEIYLGTSQTAVTNATPASAQYMGNYSDAGLYLPRPALTAGTTYYWRVDTVNPWGQVTKGPVWRLDATSASGRNAVQNSNWMMYR